MRHRSQYLEAVKAGNWNIAIMSLYNINALLPCALEDGDADYQVKINNQEYQKQMREAKFITCTECEKECRFDKIIQYDLLLNASDRFFSGKSSVRMWGCLECGKHNEFQTNKIIVEKREEPFFLKVIPEPPANTRGISDRTTFDSKCENWCNRASQEIEHQIGLYRADYQSQEQGDVYRNTPDD